MTITKIGLNKTYKVIYNGKLSIKDHLNILLESLPPLIGIILLIVGFIIIF